MFMTMSLYGQCNYTDNVITQTMQSQFSIFDVTYDKDQHHKTATLFTT